MPKEHKRRGRREEKKKRKYEDDEQREEEPPSHRLKQQHRSLDTIEDAVEADTAYYADAYAGRPEIPFYGLLDEDEQEYFKRADSMLELNQFANEDEKTLFLTSIYQEAKGKELKIVNSQSCSRLMERLIMMSTSSQLKSLFQTLNGHFLHISQHRFASHCCETLFLRCAPIVTQELLAPIDAQPQVDDGGEIFVTMENLFLYAVNELQDNLGYLMTDPFASHTLRVLLLVLSGRPLEDTSTLLQSRKKENIPRLFLNGSMAETSKASRTVPASFHTAVEKVITGTVAGLDTTSLRALATHPTGNPVLQLLLDLELSSSGKEKAKAAGSLFRKLIREESPEEKEDTISFVNGLAYDTIGSRLLEVIIKSAPGTTFKMLYARISDKIGVWVKNDVAGFIVVRLLERLSQDDLRSAMGEICPQLGLLIERSRTSVVRTLIERCRARGVELQPLIDAIVRAYGTNPSVRLIKMLRINTDNTEGMAQDRKTQFEINDSKKVHGSLLAQTMLQTQGALRDLIVDGLLEVDTIRLLQLAKDRTATRTLQFSLTCTDQSAKFRRVMIQRFYGKITDLATDTIGSYVIDQFWSASKEMPFIREAIAVEMLKNEVAIKETYPGRAVWKNWQMDNFKTKKRDWLIWAKEKEIRGGQSAIELARERKFAEAARVKRQAGLTGQRKAPKGKIQIGTGANAI